MRHISKALLGCMALALATVSATAQADYPNRTVTIVVPFAAGGTTDMLGRILADRLSQRLKGTFIVENKAGAGGNIGVASVAKATPDGYTIGMGTVSTHSINPNVYKAMPYDHVKDFIPLSLVASVPNILLVNPSVKANTVPELVAFLKSEPVSTPLPHPAPARRSIWQVSCSSWPRKPISSTCPIARVARSPMISSPAKS